eukprot:COSAG02_NODE_24601_length_683_cov_0.864726_1_plen_208_part_10
MPPSGYAALKGDDGSTPAASSGFVPLDRDAVSAGGTAAKPAEENNAGGAGSEIVTLTVHAHFFVDSVSYSGVPLEGLDTKVDGGMMHPASIQKLTFHPKPGGVLAIAAHSTAEYSAKNGNLRSLTIMCESTRSDSPWNFALMPQNAPYYARALAVPAGEAPELDGWQDDEFDDGEWGAPTSVQDAGSTDPWGGRAPDKIPRATAVWFG